MDFLEYRNTYFNRDTDQALKSLATQGYTKEYLFGFTEQEVNDMIYNLYGKFADRYMGFLGDAIEEHPEVTGTIVKAGVYSAMLGLPTDMEVNSDTKNPFTRRFVISLCAAIGTALVGVCIVWISESDWLDKVGIFFCSGFPCFGSLVAINLYHVCMFRKLKKMQLKLKNGNFKKK